MQFRGHRGHEIAECTVFWLLADPDFYNQAQSKGQTLIVAGVKNFPIEITNGIRMDQKDIDALHEEADMIIVK